MATSSTCVNTRAFQHQTKRYRTHVVQSSSKQGGVLLPQPPHGFLAVNVYLPPHCYSPGDRGGRSYTGLKRVYRFVFWPGYWLARRTAWAAVTASPPPPPSPAAPPWPAWPPAAAAGAAPLRGLRRHTRVQGASSSGCTTRGDSARLGMPVSFEQVRRGPSSNTMSQSGMSRSIAVSATTCTHTLLSHVSQTTCTCARAGCHAPSATLLCVADQ